MNKLQFHHFCSKYEDKFKQGFASSRDEAVFGNSNESIQHFLKKAEVWFKLKRQIPSEFLDEGKTPKWYSPRVFTEVRIGKNCFDIVALALDGAYIGEVAESEDEKSLKRKERNAMNLGFKFIEIKKDIGII